MSIRSMILTLVVCCFAVGCVEEGRVLVDEGTVEGVAPEATTLTGITYLQQSSARCHSMPKVTQCGGRSGNKLFTINIVKSELLNLEVLDDLETLLKLLAIVNVTKNNLSDFIDILDDNVVNLLSNNDVDVEDNNVQICSFDILSAAKDCKQDC